MAASLVASRLVKYDPTSQVLVGEYDVDFTDKPQETHRKVIHRVQEGTEGAMLARHGDILVESLNTTTAVRGTDEIKHSDSDTVWAELPSGPNKQALAQTSVRQAADYSQQVQQFLANRDTRAEAATPAAYAYELLKKVFPEILSWGWSGSQINAYLNITTAERNELQTLWTYQDTNRQVMVDLKGYLTGLPVATVESPVDVPAAQAAKRPPRGRR